MTSPLRSLHVRAVAALSAAAIALSACGSDGGAAEPGAGSAAVTAPATASAGSDGTGSSPSDGSASAPSSEGAAEGSGDVAIQESAIQENGPITITGDPLVPYAQAATDPAVGSVAPVVDGESFDGTPVSIGGPTEDPTMVVFLAHWCPHCNDEVPVLVGMERDGTFPEGVDVVGVSTAVDESRGNFPPSGWMASEGWPWPVMADDEAADALRSFGATSFPFTVLLDTDGSVLARRAGEATAEQTRAFVSDALSAA